MRWQRRGARRSGTPRSGSTARNARSTSIRRADLGPGQTFAGPAVVTQDDCTTVVPPGYVTRVDEYANLRITREAAQ